jgi:hypothetical protein
LICPSCGVDQVQRGVDRTVWHQLGGDIWTTCWAVNDCGAVIEGSRPARLVKVPGKRQRGSQAAKDAGWGRSTK